MPERLGRCKCAFVTYRALRVHGRANCLDLRHAFEARVHKLLCFAVSLKAHVQKLAAIYDGFDGPGAPTVAICF